MTEQDLTAQLRDARMIAEELHELLHEDAMHRTRLYNEYSHECYSNKWSPNLYHRCQLVEALRRKLNVSI